MIISVTERGTFRRCKQMWDYSSFNRQGLTAASIQPTALSFGTLIHKSHELWLLNPEVDPKNHVINAASETLDKLKAAYKQVVGVEPEEAELAGFYDQVALANEIVDNYKERWGASLPEGYRLLAPEQTIINPIPGTEHKCETCAGTGHVQDAPCAECKGSTVSFHYLEATLDGLMKDAGERLWVLERKTYNTRPKVEALQSNDQFIAYLWSINQLKVGEIGGVFYDGMWKRSRFDDRGKERALDDLFLRVPLIRGPEELFNFEKQLRDEALDMTAPDLRIYRNRQWMGCWDCQFERLCTAEFREEDADYIREKFYTQRTRNDWQHEEAA